MQTSSNIKSSLDLFIGDDSLPLLGSCMPLLRALTRRHARARVFAEAGVMNVVDGLAAHVKERLVRVLPAQAAEAAAPAPVCLVLPGAHLSSNYRCQIMAPLCPSLLLEVGWPGSPDAEVPPPAVPLRHGRLTAFRFSMDHRPGGVGYLKDSRANESNRRAWLSSPLAASALAGALDLPASVLVRRPGRRVLMLAPCHLFQWEEVLRAWAQSIEPLTVLVTPGPHAKKLLEIIRQRDWLAHSQRLFVMRNLELVFLPHMTPRQATDALWGCDLLLGADHHFSWLALQSGVPQLWFGEPVRLDLHALRGESVATSAATQFWSQYYPSAPLPYAAATAGLSRALRHSALTGVGFAAAWRSCELRFGELNQRAIEWASQLKAAPDLVQVIAAFRDCFCPPSQWRDAEETLAFEETRPLV